MIRVARLAAVGREVDECVPVRRVLALDDPTGAVELVVVLSCAYLVLDADGVLFAGGDGEDVDVSPLAPHREVVAVEEQSVEYVHTAAGGSRHVVEKAADYGIPQAMVLVGVEQPSQNVAVPYLHASDAEHVEEVELVGPFIQGLETVDIEKKVPQGENI